VFISGPSYYWLLAADEQQINADFGKPDRKRRTRAIPVAEAPKEFPA
jgi:hypothetical protein